MHFSSSSNLSKLHYPTEKYMTFFVSWKTYTEKINDSHISMQVNMDELLCKAGIGDNCAMSCISHLSFCSQTGSENHQLGVFAYTWENLVCYMSVTTPWFWVNFAFKGTWKRWTVLIRRILHLEMDISWKCLQFTVWYYQTDMKVHEHFSNER